MFVNIANDLASTLLASKCYKYSLALLDHFVTLEYTRKIAICLTSSHIAISLLKQFFWTHFELKIIEMLL